MGKYYVGFDVGIKNLAFCVIDSEIYKMYNSTTSNNENSGVSRSDTTNPASQDSGGALHAPTNLAKPNSGKIP